jgi:allantoin racemase
MVLIPGEEGGLMPGKPSEEFIAWKEYLMQFASPGTDIEAFPTKGAQYVLHGRDMAMIVPSAVQTAIQGEKDGFDAVIIYGMCDFGIEAVREVVDIPVVGLADVAFHVACMLADKFGVISAPDVGTPQLLRRWRLIGIDSNRIASVRSINLPILPERKDEIEAKFIELAKKQVGEDGAQAIVPGCGLYLPLLGSGSEKRLERVLDVPVINPAATAVRFAEMMAALKLSQSRKAYPSEAIYTFHA